MQIKSGFWNDEIAHTPYAKMMWIIDKCVALHHIDVIQPRHIRWKTILWIGTWRCLTESLVFISLPWKTRPTPAWTLCLHRILIHHSWYNHVIIWNKIVFLKKIWKECFFSEWTKLMTSIHLVHSNRFVVVTKTDCHCPMCSWVGAYSDVNGIVHSIDMVHF